MLQILHIAYLLVYYMPWTIFSLNLYTLVMQSVVLKMTMPTGDCIIMTCLLTKQENWHFSVLCTEHKVRKIIIIIIHGFEISSILSSVAVSLNKIYILKFT